MAQEDTESSQKYCIKLKDKPYNGSFTDFHLLCWHSRIPFCFFSSGSSFAVTHCPSLSSFSPWTNNSLSDGFSLHHVSLHFLLFSKYLWGWWGSCCVKEILKITSLHAGKSQMWTNLSLKQLNPLASTSDCRERTALSLSCGWPGRNTFKVENDCIWWIYVMHTKWVSRVETHK